MSTSLSELSSGSDSEWANNLTLLVRFAGEPVENQVSTTVRTYPAVFTVARDGRHEYVHAENEVDQNRS